MTSPLYALLSELEAASVHFTTGRYRPIPSSSRSPWPASVEVDVLEDGHMEVPRFAGSEDAGEEPVRWIIDEDREAKRRYESIVKNEQAH